jgi:hypothetical protein
VPARIRCLAEPEFEAYQVRCFFYVKGLAVHRHRIRIRYGIDSAAVRRRGNTDARARSRGNTPTNASSPSTLVLRRRAPCDGRSSLRCRARRHRERPARSQRSVPGPMGEGRSSARGLVLPLGVHRQRADGRAPSAR